MKVLGNINNIQIKLLDFDTAKLNETFLNLIDSLKKFNKELNNDKLSEFNSRIDMLSDSISILTGKFSDFSDSQKTSNDVLERYRDT